MEAKENEMVSLKVNYATETERLRSELTRKNNELIHIRSSKTVDYDL